MDTSSLTPVQQLRLWLSASAEDQVAALDGLPVGALLDHCLLSLETGQAAAQHELSVLQALIERWLLRFRADIAAFPDPAVAVLQRQKAQLLDTCAALERLQQRLLRLHASPAQAPDWTPAQAVNPAGAWPRFRGPQAGRGHWRRVQAQR
ncbi:hypothetical protein WG899_18100 [Paucibacter sp. AS339]|uniref:hypothetical protein n=1 Tax=Paucibacter hankyongi TaxID=3133434 RepID=UPI0030B7A5F1